MRQAVAGACSPVSIVDIVGPEAQAYEEQNELCALCLRLLQRQLLDISPTLVPACSQRKGTIDSLAALESRGTICTMEKEPGSVTRSHVTTSREDLNKHPSRAGKCWTPQEDLYSLLWDASPVFNHIANQDWAVMGLDEDLE